MLLQIINAAGSLSVKKTVLWSLIICLPVLTAACGTSRTGRDSGGAPFVQGAKSVEVISSTPESVTSKDESFKTILVVVLVPRESMRKSTEDAMVRHLLDANIGAVPSYQALSPGHDLTKEFLEEQLKDTGVDAVLMLRLVDMETKIAPEDDRTVNPGADEAMPALYGGRDMYGYYHNMALSGNMRDVNIVNREVQVNVRLFCFADAKQVWQGEFKVFNQPSASGVIGKIAQSTIDQLREKNLVK